MTSLLAFEVELLPTGEPDAPRTEPKHRICGECGADAFTEPHGPRCLARAEVLRLNVTNDPEERRREDALEAANHKALIAWLRSGRTIP